MRVLISGANGFIGRALCSHLSNKGYEVTPAVRRPCGIIGERVANDAQSWSSALVGCSSVVHLAGITHIANGSDTDELEIFRNINVKGTEELARRAVSAGVRRFIFLSTVKVHGEVSEPGGKFKPDDLVSPKSSYAISKWEAECKLREIARNTELEVVIIRPPLVYGPKVRGNFASLIDLVRSEWFLPLRNVRNRRSMIGLENLVSIIELCANYDASSRVQDQIFLVSDGEDISTTELVRKIAGAYRCKCRLLPFPVGLIRFLARLANKTSVADRLFGSLVVDGSKTRELLRWSPTLTVDQQLEKMAIRDSLF